MKKWIRELEIVTDDQMREFIGLVQQNLRQADVPLDFGVREAPKDKTVGHCKVVSGETKEDQQSNDSDADPATSHVWKVRQYGTERKSERDYRLTNRLRAETGQVFGVGGAPVTVVGKVDIPISVSDEEARWTRVRILEGEEQALLLGRQFLRSFGRVMFDWDKGVITLGKVKISIQEQAIGGDPLARAR